MALEIEDRRSDSPYVGRVWRSRTSDVKQMTSVATSTWELVFWEQHGRVFVAAGGPETGVSAAQVPDNTDSFGITFSHGTTMPHLSVPQLVNAHVSCLHVTSKRFVLRGEEWELPTFDNAEVFVDRLVREGVLVRDPLVPDAIEGNLLPMVGARSVQRRVAAGTGLTLGAIRQIERAREAAILLMGGSAPLDVVHELDYYDQPHLSRSLTRFIGRTATQLRTQSIPEPLSLLYKTEA
jgi:hypothetical protein